MPKKLILPNKSTKLS